jgi:Putative restriction endonuclease
MGLPLEAPRRATYADLEAVPSYQVAELIHGLLRVFPRPAPPHARAASRLGGKLMGPFDLGEGGPGGWHILDEPELHFPDPSAPGEEEALVPDLAGWRVERMPRLPKTAYIETAPDWVCEILSRRTEATDRAEKMPIYAREGVRHAWLIHPIRRTFELFELTANGHWTLMAVHQGSKRVRAEPFAAIEIDLGQLFPDEDSAALWDEEEREEAEDEITPAPATRPKVMRPSAAKARRRGRK